MAQNDTKRSDHVLLWWMDWRECADALDRECGRLSDMIASLKEYNDLCITETARRNPGLSARLPWNVMNGKGKTDA